MFSTASAISSGRVISTCQTVIPSCSSFCRAVWGLPDFQAMTRSGSSSIMRSRSIRNASPIRGICFTCAGKLLYSTTALSCSPAPAANTSSARLGARVIMRSAGVARVRVSPFACGNVTPANDVGAAISPEAIKSVDKSRLNTGRARGQVMRSHSPTAVWPVPWPTRPVSARPGPWTV